MKQPTLLWLGLALFGGMVSDTFAQVESRLSLQARMGFNTQVRFAGAPVLTPVGPARIAPDGEVYNFDDGYVLTDVSDNYGGQTWNWGYDDSARQVSGNSILMSRSLGTGSASATSASDNPSWGGELVYDLMAPYREGGLSYGLQVAGNYQGLDVVDRGTALASVQRRVYPFAFTPGTTPPTARPGEPYQGTFDGPGFVIGATPGTPYLDYQAAGALVTGHRQFEANLWGLRLGPSLEIPLRERLSANFSFGAAMGYLDADVSWTETVLVAGRSARVSQGTEHDSSLLMGVYGGITFHYQVTEHFNLNLGAYYQHLEDYRHNFGGRTVQLDMEDSVFLNFGVGYSF